MPVEWSKDQATHLRVHHIRNHCPGDQATRAYNEGLWVVSTALDKIFHFPEFLFDTHAQENYIHLFDAHAQDNYIHLVDAHAQDNYIHLFDKMYTIYLNGEARGRGGGTVTFGSGGGKGGRGGGRGGSRGGGRGGGRGGITKAKVFSGKCNVCHVRGHKASECPVRALLRQQAEAAEAAAAAEAAEAAVAAQQQQRRERISALRAELAELEGGQEVGQSDATADDDAAAAYRAGPKGDGDTTMG
ncbi:hypothetical protein QQX98_001599 [Neonectria punicea]|uniref:CCHC-type domain-containing protein n=1 Tax=Neonectria punicea TaxID=979145 RepID=A0ABR1HN53_9HYPO